MERRHGMDKQKPLPTLQQIEWADQEIGVIFHLDLQVFDPGYDYLDLKAKPPPAACFAPSSLDTDQWLSVAKSAGAGYAILVAKHCSGFSLWPTEAHDYSVASSPWKGGRGDVVADFVQSCAKYGIRPGLYYSTTWNSCFNIEPPGRVRSGDKTEQFRYNQIVLQQLRELWTRYGKWFEIWFDGGTMPVELGGPDVTPLLHELQPQAVCFQGPRGTNSNVRWAGNEIGFVEYPCWSTTTWKKAEDAALQNLTGAPAEVAAAEFPAFGSGDPDGELWAPAENDMTNRHKDKAFVGGWFWRRGEDHLVYPVSEMVERYYQCVGRNANALIGAVIDDRGLVPEADAKQFAGFGAEIGRRFGKPIGLVSGIGKELRLDFGSLKTINHVILMEDIAQGERVRLYAVDVLEDGMWRELLKGSCIGHKRIERFPAVCVSALRWRCVAAQAEPKLRSLAAYNVV